MLNILPRSTLFIQQGSNIQKQHVPCSKIQMVTMFMRLICIFLHRERAKLNSRSKLQSFFQTAKHPSKSKRHSIYIIYYIYIYYLYIYIYKYVKVSGFPPFLVEPPSSLQETVPCCVSLQLVAMSCCVPEAEPMYSSVPWQISPLNGPNDVETTPPKPWFWLGWLGCLRIFGEGIG